MKKSFTVKLFALMLVVGLLFAAVPTGQVQAQMQIQASFEAVDDEYTTVKNMDLEVDAPGVLSNDSYEDFWHNLRHYFFYDLEIETPPSGTLDLEDDGSFTYTPDEDFIGTDTFEYTIRMRSWSYFGGWTYQYSTATVTITVTQGAVDDEYTTAEDVVLSEPAPGVLSNDPDYDEITMTAVKASSPAHGALVLASDGSFVYTPNQDYYGTDSFTYYYTDGESPSNIATVTITVTPVKDQVEAVDDEYHTNKGVTLVVDDSSLQVKGVLFNDIDVDNNEMTANLLSDVSHGALTLNGDGTFVYIPDAGFTGVDSFRYQLVTYPAEASPTNSTIQSLWTDEADVTIWVHDGPTIESIVAIGATGFDDVTAVERTLYVDQGYEVDTIEITMSEDVLVDIDTVVTIDPPNAAYGTVTGVDGAVITVTPNTGNATASAVGIFTFSIPEGAVVTESHGAAWENVPVKLVVENVAPVAEDQSVTTPEDTDIDITLIATDAGDDELTYEIVDEPTHGTVDLVGDVATYSPDQDYHGTDSFTFKANDGLADSNVATVSITITSVKDQVIAVDDEYETNENMTLNVPAPGVLANDIDVDNNIMTATLVSNVSHGTLTLNGDGSFVYIPDAGFTGEDSFEYELVTTPAGPTVQSLWTDTATVTIEVLENEPPVAQDDAYTTEVNMVLNISEVDGVLANDDDYQGTILTAIKVTDPANGTLVLNADGSFTYTPNTGFTGVDIFTYKANDGLADSNIATVRITVVAFVNTPPVAQDQSVTTPEDTPIDITLVATDVDGDPLTYAIVNPPAHGTVTLVGNLATYMPDLDYHGLESFTFKANDGTVDSNIATVSITVSPVNDAPIAVDDEYTVAEKETLTVAAPGILENDSDVDGDPLTAILVDAVSNGTLTLNADGSFVYTPDPYFNGTDSFTYKAFDGELESALAVVTITVTPVNDWPIANDDYYEVTTGTTLVKDAVEGVLANDVLLDPDEQVSIQILEGPRHGTLSMNDDGSFTYTPNAGYMGPDSFRYLLLSVQVNADQWSDDAWVYIDVKPVMRLFLPIILR